MHAGADDPRTNGHPAAAPEGCCRDVTVRNAEGLHMRPATLVVQTAARFASVVRIRKGETEADAKSLLQLFSLAAECGTPLRLSATGPDAEAAVAALAELVESGFQVAGPGP